MSVDKKNRKKTPPAELSGVETYEKIADGKESRWFVVTAERFDWLFAPNKMKSFKRGQICYEPRECVRIGREAGLIEEIERPANATVDKSGRVILS